MCADQPSFVSNLVATGKTTTELEKTLKVLNTLGLERHDREARGISHGIDRLPATFRKILFQAGILARTEGEVAFRYHEDYLASPAAAPLSLSLPLQAEPYTEEELTPYFRGSFARGGRLWKISAAAWAFPRDDYIAMLCRLRAPIAWATSSSILLSIPKRAPMKAVSLDQIKEMAGQAGHRSTSPWKWPRLFPSQAPRISCGLLHDPAAPITEGWYQPVGGAPSNYIVKFAREDLIDLMQVEHLSMTCAAAMRTRCGSNRPHHP